MSMSLSGPFSLEGIMSNTMNNNNESLLKILAGDFPFLGYRFDGNFVVVLYQDFVSGKVSLGKSKQDFIDWVLYYYDMAKMTFVEC